MIGFSLLGSLLTFVGGVLVGWGLRGMDGAKTYECCRTCRRTAEIRSRRKRGMQSRGNVSKAEMRRELLRTKVYALPNSTYRTAMLAAYAAFDAWEAMDKRPQRYGRPKKKAA